MNFDLRKTLETLAWPVGLIAVFAAILSLFGVSLDVVIAIASSMIGLQLLISLGVDVLKWAGVVNDGTAGKWSAAFNLIGLAVIASTLVWNPSFDFVKLDAQLIDIAKFMALLFSYIVQVAGTKQVHQFTTKGIGLKAFTKSSA